MSEELKPCPFCGGSGYPVKLLRDGYDKWPNDPDAYSHFIRCRGCAAEGPWAKSETGGVRGWNRRVAPRSGAARGEITLYPSTAEEWEKYAAGGAEVESHSEDAGKPLFRVEDGICGQRSGHPPQADVCKLNAGHTGSHRGNVYMWPNRAGGAEGNHA